MSGDMIVGFKALGRELQGVYTVSSLLVLDCRGRLPLTRRYHEGNRVWDADEVRRFREQKLTKRNSRSTTKADGQKGSSA